jgi:hypothetical protein
MLALKPVDLTRGQLLAIPCRVSRFTSKVECRAGLSDGKRADVV